VFTLLFEALVLSFAAAMRMAKVAAMTREHDTRIWRVVEHHVLAARDQLDCTGVRRVKMDETSAAKGQDYASIFADLDARRVVFATEGRSADTLARFATDLIEHGGDPEKVTDTSSDMSTAFISGKSPSTCRMVKTVPDPLEPAAGIHGISHTSPHDNRMTGRRSLPVERPLGDRLVQRTAIQPGT
jgi:transposase